MRDNIGEAEKAGVDWTNHHLAQLKRETLELRRRQEKLNQLSQTGDPINFFQGFQALGDPPAFTDLYERPDMLMEFVTAQKDKLKNMCSKGKHEILNQSEKTVYSNVEVDPNTVAACLSLSDRNRQMSWSSVDQAHPDHPDRFTYFNQALCQKGLTGSHYWEVEWDGGVVELAVSYKDIKRKGSGKDCCFGHNNLSWKLICSASGCRFWHNNIHKGNIPPVHSRRVGIYLDYEEGRLSYYSVSDPDTLTLLHQIQTTFTKPLYPGFSVDLGSTLKICNI
ncbi:Stonustoxin subunit alpha [Nibea albiflora]|uniref:Stonustoxin subunit alpha n=1 Tax=Nibea albiflora TaxID=240163 RepID=A0ACB7FEN3_NIBAL|nr:Stonustoxin subunit alpha [Nibea albiflora]